jgi:hypothetical protein
MSVKGYLVSDNDDDDSNYKNQLHIDVRYVKH